VSVYYKVSAYRQHELTQVRLIKYSNSGRSEALNEASAVCMHSARTQAYHRRVPGIANTISK
jgi:hypothetical protein